MAKSIKIYKLQEGIDTLPTVYRIIGRNLVDNTYFEESVIDLETQPNLPPNIIPIGYSAKKVDWKRLPALSLEFDDVTDKEELKKTKELLKRLLKIHYDEKGAFREDMVGNWVPNLNPGHVSMIFDIMLHILDGRWKQ